MTRTTTLAALGLTALAIGLACTDIIAPARGARYDWRLPVQFDSAGPQVDTLSFHWPRGSIPVKIWVENQFGVPDRVREGIALWKPVFVYGEWDAKLISDSNAADVIVRTAQPPPQSAEPGFSLPALAQPCVGATDVDTVATRFQLSVPIHVYVFPLVPADPNITACLRTVSAHELGHSLGLFQHSTDTLDLMFAVPTADALTDRDIGTAVNAYHFPADMVPVRP
jgi:predicted Zn-dependent protease